MKRSSFPLAIFVTVFLAAGSAISESQNLIVNDTSNRVQAAAEVQGAAVVEFRVTDESGNQVDGVPILLYQSPDNPMTVQVVNGVARFEGVAPGTWTVASPNGGIVFQNVSILSGAAVTGGTALAGFTFKTVAGTVIGTGAAVGGAFAIKNAAESDGDGNPLHPNE